MLAAAAQSTDNTALVLVALITAGGAILSGVIGAGAALLSARLTSTREAVRIAVQLDHQRQQAQLEDERRLRDKRRVRLARLFEAGLRAATSLRDIEQRKSFSLTSEDPQAVKKWMSEQRAKADTQLEIASIPLRVEKEAARFYATFEDFQKHLVEYFVAWGGPPGTPGRTLEKVDDDIKKLVEIAQKDLARLESSI